MNVGMMNAKPQRKLRTGAGGRGPRVRGNLDKSLLNEGVYSNPRFMNVCTSLIGCEVQVTVKNGGIYEGIFRTLSPQLDVVLEAAHKMDEVNPKAVPSKDRIIETVIFHIRDVMMLSATNVDVDYACRDSFTDTSISKFNGQVSERELQPWDSGDIVDEIDLEAGSSSLGSSPHDTVLAPVSVAGPGNKNGWDPNDMFRLNAETFGVKSSYDPSLAQYTTPLKQENTKEYKEREAQAARIAQEIEGSSAYNARIELENGDDNEEEKFSAVMRPNEGGATNNGSSRYVPPHLRKDPKQGRAAIRAGVPPGGRQHRDSQSPSSNPSGTTPPIPSSPQPNPKDNPKFNGAESEELEKLPMTAEVSAAAAIDKAEHKEHNPAYKQNESRKAPPRDNKLVQELKEFSTNFKVKLPSDDKESKGQLQPSNSPGRPDGHPSMPHPPHQHKDNLDDHKKEPQVEKKIEDTLKKSNLNPNAKEFVFNPNAKPFTPKQPMQVPTPPRPQTQSPVIVPQQHMAMQPPLYPQHPTPYMVPVSMPPAVNQQQTRFTHKRAVVSVQPPRQEFSQAAAQAAAATGQPLLAQPAMTQQQPQYTVQYMTPMGGPTQQIQMVPMAAGTRMVAPHVQQGGHIGAAGADQSAAVQQQNQHQQQQATVFMSPPGQPGQMPHQHTHIHHASAAGHPPAPAHVTPHHQPTPPHSQPSHMNSAAAASAQGGPHAPSPVQHHPSHQQGHPGAHPGAPQGHPGSSATPQPHLIYQHNQQMSQQAGHPPLQPSPHTPTSPQSMYPPTISYAPPGVYSYSAQGPIQAVPHSYTHTSQHTTVTHAQHQQHQHLPHPHQGPQIVMMHNPQHQHAAAAAAPQHMQHAAHIQGHHMQGPIPGQAGPPPMMPQQTTINASQPNVHHPQMHYVPHPQKYATKI